jgi:hypothetical protein
MPDEAIAKELPSARHETSDVRVRAALVGLVATALALLTIVLLPRWLFPAARTPTMATAPPPFAAPQLQPNPRADMQSFRSGEMRWLNGTGWVDKSRGIVHIPIDDAMRRIAESGIADWPVQPVRGTK